MCFVFVELQKISTVDSKSSNSEFMVRICFENSMVSSIPHPVDEAMLDGAAVLALPDLGSVDSCELFPREDEFCLIDPVHGTCKIRLISSS